MANFVFGQQQQQQNNDQNKISAMKKQIDAMLLQAEKQEERKKEADNVQTIIKNNYSGKGLEDMGIKTYSDLRNILGTMPKPDKGGGDSNFFGEMSIRAGKTKPKKEGEEVKDEVENLVPSTSSEYNVLDRYIQADKVKTYISKMEKDSDSPFDIGTIYEDTELSTESKDILLKKWKEKEADKMFVDIIKSKIDGIPENVSSLAEYENWTKLSDEEKLIQKTKNDINTLVAIENADADWTVEKLEKLTDAQLKKQVERGRWVQESKDLLKEYQDYKPFYATNTNFVDTEEEVKQLRNDLITIKAVDDGIKHMNDTFKGFISDEEANSMITSMRNDTTSGKKNVSTQIAKKIRQSINDGTKPIEDIQEVISENSAVFNANDLMALTTKAEEKQMGMRLMEVGGNSIIALAKTFGVREKEIEDIKTYIELKKKNNAHLSKSELMKTFGMYDRLNKLTKTEKTILDELELYINHFNSSLNKDKEQ